MTTKRICLIVLDSVGIGELPDAGEFGDKGAHTLGHIAQRVSDFAVPQLHQLQKLGLGNIATLRGVDPAASPIAATGLGRSFLHELQIIG